MPSADYHKMQIIQTQENLDMFYQTINNFKMPYKYFKKLNILPLDIVENEIDKYFDITTLILENFSEAKHISYKLEYLFKTSYINEELKNNFCKYYNYIPINLLVDYSLEDYIINNYKKYKKANVITPTIDIEMREKLDNEINNIILFNKNTIKYHTQQIIEIEDRKKYKIPVHRFPIDSKLLITEYPNCRYNDIIIVKICKKIIKYQDYNRVFRQVKIEILEDYLDTIDYELVDKNDRQKKYCIDDYDNIYLGC